MKDRFITTGSDMCKQFRSAFIGMPGVTIYADEIISEGDFFGEIRLNGLHFLEVCRFKREKCFELRYVDFSERDNRLCIIAEYKSIRRAITAAKRIIKEGKRTNPIKVYN